MSRRRVSVKDLGLLDCQGWLQRRKESRSFLGSKWKRCWFVLKRSSLYWYRDKTDEEAEGFINLSGFTIEQAKHCRKKHAVTASHPQVVTLYVAAQTFTDMNKWISKLSEAAELREEIDAEDCYSEGSEQDEGMSMCSQDSDHETPESEIGDIVQPLVESPSCSSSSTTLTENSSSSEGGSLSMTRRGGNHPSRHEEPAGAAPLPLIQVDREEVVHDEMESLYNDLRAASLLVTGQSNRRDFRASFVRRCHDDRVNDKLHLLRILSSTLKAKEAELQTVEQILEEPTLSVNAYREWRLSNHILLQEMCKRSQAVGANVCEPSTTDHVC